MKLVKQNITMVRQSLQGNFLLSDFGKCFWTPCVYPFQNYRPIVHTSLDMQHSRRASEVLNNAVHCTGLQILFDYSSYTHSPLKFNSFLWYSTTHHQYPAGLKKKSFKMALICGTPCTIIRGILGCASKWTKWTAKRAAIRGDICLRYSQEEGWPSPLVKSKTWQRSFVLGGGIFLGFSLLGNPFCILSMYLCGTKKCLSTRVRERKRKGF